MAEVKVADEPVTVIISAQGWARARQGHGHDAAAFAFKAGDGLYAAFECRSVDHLLIFGSDGRVYSAPVASLPGARGDGQPVTTLIELQAGSQPVHYFAGPASATLLLCASSGHGFLAQVEHMLSRHKGGKSFITLAEGARICRPALVHTGQAPAGGQASSGQTTGAADTHVACVSTGGRLLTFALEEIRLMEKGGRGLTLIALEKGDALAGAASYARGIRVTGTGRGGKAREEVLEIRSLNNALAARARKGRDGHFGFKPQQVQRVA